MQRRKFSREFKLEAVKLVRDRGVSVSQAARDLDVHTNVLRKWVREAVSDPGSAFPGHGTMKPEQQEIERLRRELARMKAERDILKKAAAYFEGLDMRFAFVSKHRGIWPVSWICEASASRAAAFMPGRFGHQVPVRVAIPTLRRRSAPASYPATGPMGPAGFGTIFWPKAYHAAFTVWNG